MNELKYFYKSDKLFSSILFTICICPLSLFTYTYILRTVFNSEFGLLDLSFCGLFILISSMFSFILHDVHKDSFLLSTMPVTRKRLALYRVIYYNSITILIAIIATLYYFINNLFYSFQFSIYSILLYFFLCGLLSLILTGLLTMLLCSIKTSRFIKFISLLGFGIPFLIVFMTFSLNEINNISYDSGILLFIFIPEILLVLLLNYCSYRALVKYYKLDIDVQESLPFKNN
jgi:hypothetical protein